MQEAATAKAAGSWDADDDMPSRDSGLALIVQEGRSSWCFKADEQRRAAMGFAVRSAYGQGFGVFATRSFAPGDLLLVDPPLVSWPIGMQMTRENVRRGIEWLVSDMTSDARAQMSSLMHSPGKHGESRTNFAVFQSNCLPSHEDGGASLFADACRVNHSCSPSLDQTFDSVTRAQRLRVVRAVAHGEQLSIAYTSEPGTRAERRARLQQRFGFLCECSLCSLEGPELEQSDARQRRMSELRKRLLRPTESKEPEDVAAARDPASVLEAVDQMLLLQRLESLPTTWGQQYQIMGMQLCLKQSNVRKASDYARAAAEATRIGAGVEVAMYKQLMSIVSRLQGEAMAVEQAEAAAEIAKAKARAEAEAKKAAAAAAAAVAREASEREAAAREAAAREVAAREAAEREAAAREAAARHEEARAVLACKPTVPMEGRKDDTASAAMDALERNMTSLRYSSALLEERRSATMDIMAICRATLQRSDALLSGYAQQGQGHYNPRLRAMNVWEVAVPPDVIDEARAIFEASRLSEAFDALKDGDERYLHVAAADGKRFFAQKSEKNEGSSDISYISADDPPTYATFENLFDKLNLEESFAHVIQPLRRLQMYTASFVVRSQCASPVFHSDWPTGLGGHAITLMTPLADYKERSAFNLLYGQSEAQTPQEIDDEGGEHERGSADGPTPMELMGNQARYEYKKGTAICFGASFCHSTEPGSAHADDGLHAYLCFTFGTDDPQHWPMIADTISYYTRVCRDTDGNLVPTLLGKSLQKGGDDAPASSASHT